MNSGNPTMDGLLKRSIKKMQEDSWQQTIYIGIDIIKAHPWNFELFGDPRLDPSYEETRESIRVNGLMHNIVVKRDPDKFEGYILISGHKRWTAFLDLSVEGLKDFKVIRSVVMKFDNEENERLYFLQANSTQRILTNNQLFILSENIKDLYNQMKLSNNPSISGIRKREYVAEVLDIGITKANNLLRLNELNEDLKNEYLKGHITNHQLTEILKLDDTSKKELDDVVKKNGKWDNKFLVQTIKNRNARKSIKYITKKNSPSKKSIFDLIEKRLLGIKAISNFEDQERVNKIIEYCKEIFK